MYQGTTPTILLTLEGAEDLDQATCYVTFKHGVNKTLTKSGSDLVVDDNEIAVFLSQEETLAMIPGGCDVQVRWIDENGNAMTTDVAKIQVNSVLLKQIIEYHGGGAG